MKLIIFDFDGTLVDSRPLILESHRIVFSEFRLPAPLPAHSLALVGKSLDVILAELAGPAAPILEMVKAYDGLLPRLRADPAFAAIPVIVFSSAYDVGAIAARLGVRDYLTKPLDIQRLLDGIRRHCSTPAQR